MARNAVLIVGLGSLAKKLLIALSRDASVDTIVVVSRSRAAASWCELCNLLGKARVVFAAGSALERQRLAALLAEFRPRLIIQAASLVSPFAFYRHPLQHVAAAAGFALHLPAQLPVALATMRAVQDVCPEAQVVNCSFPDLTNQVLGRLHMAPALGIGNAGILQLMLAKQFALQDPQVPACELGVVAHHSQVIPLLRGQPLPAEVPPLVVVDGRVRAWSECPKPPAQCYEGEAINELAAAAALPVIRAMLDPQADTYASVPGPNGLPGGYPVEIRRGRPRVRLPLGVSLSEAVERNEAAARLDGVEHVDDRGVVHFTGAFKAAVEPLARELAEPLRPEGALERFRALCEVFGVESVGHPRAVQVIHRDTRGKAHAG